MIERVGVRRRESGAAATRQGNSARLLLAALVAVAAVLALAPPALAARKYLPVAQFPPPYPEAEEWTPHEFTLRPDSVAVSDKNHHVYVADSGRGAIYDFSSITDKTPVRWNGTNTPKGTFGGEQVSVAADNTTGDVYVADRAHAVIDKFDENGNLIASFGDTTPADNGPNGQLAGLETPDGSFSPSLGFYSGFGIAVDQASHDLYVLDAGHEVIDIFSEEGAYLSQITDTPEGLYTENGAYASGIAVSSTGNVYVSSWLGPNRIYQFGPTNKYVSTWDGHHLPNGPASETPDGNFSPESTGCCLISAGVEDSTGHVFVVDFHYVLNVFDANGNFIPPQATQTELGFQYLSYPSGVTVDQETGHVYVSNGSQVQIFRPVIVPDLSIGAVSGIGNTAATLNGHVDPATGEGGGPITECYFEYLTVYEFAENGAQSPFRGARKAPCSPTPSSSPTDVSADIAGLAPGTQYQFRLVVANAEGHNVEFGPKFATVGNYGFSSQFGSSGSGDGQLKEPKDVAVDDSTGDVYVADTGNHRVDEFSNSGSFIRAFGGDVGGPGVGVCTSGCQAGTAESGPGSFKAPKFVEVDNSGGPSDGDVYVADATERVIEKFDSSGSLITGWGGGGSISFVKKEGAIGGIAVDTLGNLHVLTDAEPYNWRIISQDGVAITKFPTNGSFEDGRFNMGIPGGNGIDVGTGETWFETKEAGLSTGVSYSTTTSEEYATGYLYAPGGPPLANSGLAINHSTSDVYVDQGTWIDEFEGNECASAGSGPGAQGCRPTVSFGLGQLDGASGIALRPSSDAIYAANTGEDDVVVFTRLPRPEVTTGQATAVEPTSATLTGHVDPGPGGEIGDCHFEYLKGNITNEIQVVSFNKATKEGSFTATFEGQTTQPVTLAIGNNATASTFQFWLEQLSSIGAGNVRVTGGEMGPFKVEFRGRFSNLNVPQITVDSSGLGPSGAGAEAIPSTKYEGNGWVYAQSVPCTPSAPISSPSDVSAHLTGLTPFDNYHYRLAAGRTDGGGFLRRGGERVVTPTPTQAPSVDGSGSGGVTSTTVVLSAEVNPNFASTVYRFQYGLTVGYGQQTETSSSIGSDSTDHPVSTELTELAPGTTYHFRVLATNLNGPTAGPDMTFTTPDRPRITSSGVAGVTETEAQVSAQIKPGFRDTTYHVVYGRTVSYGSATGESASIGSDNVVHMVATSLAGLSPGATYHYKVIATNAIGSAEGPDMTFTTKSSPPPPEEVKPVQCKKHFVKKHGKCVRKRHHKRGKRG